MTVKKYVPNVLSTIRLGMAVVMPFVFPQFSISKKLLYFLSGNATDALDGYLARKWKVESRYGKIVDPIADKCFNLLALGCTSVFVNPLLLGLVASEAAIAGITVAHTINNIKDKNIDMSKLTMLDKTKLFVATADELKVSRIGRKKAVIMVLAASLAYTSALVPLLSIPASAFIIGVTVAELPVISRYATEYYVDKKRYKIESSIECNVTNNELGKLKKAKELLEKFNKLDKRSDALDKKILEKIKNEPIELQENSHIQDFSNVEEEKEHVKRI